MLEFIGRYHSMSLTWVTGLIESFIYGSILIYQIPLSKPFPSIDRPSFSHQYKTPTLYPAKRK